MLADQWFGLTILHALPTSKLDGAYRLGTLVTISKAAETSSYTKQHIRYLIRLGKIKGERQVGIWLVELESLQAYEQEMNEMGPQKYDPTQHKDKS